MTSVSRNVNERGSATVELAFAIPLFVALLLLMAQVCGVLVSQLAVTQAAREGARAASVEPTVAAARSAAQRSTGLNPDRLGVTLNGPDNTPGRIIGRPDNTPGMVRVQVSYPTQIVLPFTNLVLLRPVTTAQASMLLEADPL